MNIRSASTFEGLMWALEHATQPDNLILVTDLADLMIRKQALKAVAADFDETVSMTVGHPKGLEQFLSAEYRELAETRRRLYRGQSFKDITEEVLADWEREWVGHQFDVWIQHELELGHFRHAGELCELRQGAVELFSLFEHRIVISFGYETIIRFALDRHQVESEIGAMTTLFTEDGKLRPPFEGMTTHMKGVFLKAFLERHHLSHEQVLCLGDSHGDRRLFQLGGVSVFMVPLDEHSGELALTKHRVEALKLHFDQLDLVVTGHFEPLVTFLRYA